MTTNIFRVMPTMEGVSMTSYNIIVRCQDLPEVRYEIHQFELTTDPQHSMGAKMTKARYQETERTIHQVVSELQREGFVRLETPITDLDEQLFGLVTKACPPEFHLGLWEGDPKVIDRITVRVKESQHEPTARR